MKDCLRKGALKLSVQSSEKELGASRIYATWGERPPSTLMADLEAKAILT